MSKKITLINGSPRKNRSSNYLVDKAIEGITSVSEDFEIVKIQISDYKITPCNGCDKCLRPPHECPLADGDDTRKIEDLILGTDVLLIAAPNYFGSVGSQIKILIDRSRPWKMNNYRLKNVIFAPMAATGLRNSGEGVISDLVNFALIQGMMVVGNAEGTPSIEENIAITSLQKYNISEFLGKGEIDELGGRIAFDLGKRVAELALKFNK